MIFWLYLWGAVVTWFACSNIEEGADVPPMIRAIFILFWPLSVPSLAIGISLEGIWRGK